MTTRSYPRLPIEQFGAELLLTGDLDPVYVALSRMDWDEAQRNRWLLAYWCLYHPGAASWLSEQEGAEFFRWLRYAAVNDARVPEAPVGGRWPRAAERRHWRADNAVKCVMDLGRRYGARPEHMVHYCAAGALPDGQFPIPEDSTFGLVTRRVQEHVSFGPWIAYKIADMLERCCDVPVLFTEADAMYESPRLAALRVWRAKGGWPDGEQCKIKDEPQAVRDVVAYLLHEFRGHEAPPGGGRPFGLQEAETVLCKWNSHMNGHYPVGNDLREIQEGVERWAAVSPTAAMFLHGMPPEVQA